MGKVIDITAHYKRKPTDGPPEKRVVRLSEIILTPQTIKKLKETIEERLKDTPELIM